MTTTKDRSATEAKIVKAAESLLAKHGFAALSVSAVAEAAGVDRKLIYRYFGGVEGLAERLGADDTRWLAEAAPSKTRVSAFEAYADALKRDEALQQMLAWELVESSPLLTRLDRARSAAMQKRFAWLREAPTANGGDGAAENAVALAALHYLTLRARTMGGFAGLKLDAAGWARVRAVLARLIAT